MIVKKIKTWQEFIICFGFAYCLVAVVVMTLTFLVALFSPGQVVEVSVMSYGEGWWELPLVLVGFVCVLVSLFFLRVLFVVNNN